MDLTRLLLSAFFGLGFVPVAPGTAGSAGACLICWGLYRLPCGRLFVAAFAIVTIIISPVLARWAESHFKEEDPGQFVLDEVAACGLGAALLPSANVGSALVLFFVCFRILDIWKPWPIQLLERVPRGWGVLLDDLLAGLYALGVVWGGSWLFGLL